MMDGMMYATGLQPTAPANHVLAMPTTQPGAPGAWMAAAPNGNGEHLTSAERVMPNNGNYATMFSLDAPASTAFHYNVMPNAHLINPNMMNGRGGAPTAGAPMAMLQQQPTMLQPAGAAMMPTTTMKVGQPQPQATSAPLMYVQPMAPPNGRMEMAAAQAGGQAMILQQAPTAYAPAPTMVQGSWGINTIPTALLLNSSAAPTINYATAAPLPYSIAPHYAFANLPATTFAGPGRSPHLHKNNNQHLNAPKVLARQPTHANGAKLVDANSAASAEKRSLVPNGSLYQVGGWYEGVVKRYNPLRGFGFLTGITRLRVDPARCEAAFIQSEEVEAAVGRAAAQQQQQQQQAGESHLSRASSAANDELDCTDALMQQVSISATPAPGDEHGTVVLSAMQWHIEELDRAESLVRQPAELGDIFVHHTCISMAGFRVLPPNTPVRFCVEVLMNTIQAVDVVPRGGHWRRPEEGRPTCRVSHAAAMELLARRQMPQAASAGEVSSSSPRPFVMPTAAVPSSVHGRSVLQVHQPGVRSPTAATEHSSDAAAAHPLPNCSSNLASTPVEEPSSQYGQSNSFTSTTADDAGISPTDLISPSPVAPNGSDPAEGSELVWVSVAQLPAEWAGKGLTEVPMAAIPSAVAKELGISSTLPSP